ncbi:MAG: nicotinate (nicotinamide) nucleotide adenylyltransferase [Oscillospiraceae bacterium]|nr:nicotinate (nicotinamide) nucleotide adenylyltransferase [Oscillospiraceae bacterium]
MNAMKIGIYGGTFDPPHMGHMNSAAAAMDLLELDQLFLIPAGIPPHKELPAETASAEDRYAMTALMADGMGVKKRAQVLDLEICRAGEKSYTVETLEQLRKQFPNDELWLLMGSDMLLTILDWHQAERIFELASIGAFARAYDDNLELLRRHAAALEQGYGAAVRLLSVEEITDISSTEIRNALLRGTGEEFLWTPVYGYILQHRLYGTRAELSNLSDGELRAVTQSMVKAKRIPHIKGTELEAVRLAKRWKENEADARRAAILHDCTKYFSLEEQLKICEQYDILLDNLEKVSEKLLHSKTAAALARHVFGADKEVEQAIFYHTTGRAAMSELEKIIYIADYMEPTRDFDGVDTLRALAYENLDRAILLGLEMSVTDIQSRGNIVHPNTLEAIDYYRSV